MEAVDRIKKYAKGAFALNKPYYRKYYTLNDFHRNDSDTLEVKEIETDSDISDDTPLETDA